MFYLDYELIKQIQHKEKKLFGLMFSHLVWAVLFTFRKREELSPTDKYSYGDLLS